ncbi:MAG: GCN5-related N-acetyltransferase [Ferruginibacter sp.]|nr:GCN5-related N-acetyltransferase [Ferruginibacter sp.]
MNNLVIREIEPPDNAALAQIIRSALAEFKANKPGTVYFDESTDHLHELFATGKGIYYVAVADGNVVGGAGIYHTDGLENDTVELVKMYLSPGARGKGIAKMLMKQCLEAAGNAGYKKVYIETMPELIVAIPMYEQFGFTYLVGPMGNSGHNGCTIWMIKFL